MTSTLLLVGLLFAAGRNAEKRDLAERLVAGGGVYEQRLVACEQAGVTLTLRRNRRFTLAIETRCQAVRDRLTLSGTWKTKGDGSLILSFPQDEGPDEELSCRVAACEEATGEHCIECVSDDVSFRLREVRRR